MLYYTHNYKEEKQMTLPYDLTPIENPFGNIDVSQLTKVVAIHKQGIDDFYHAPEVMLSLNPIHETNKLLAEQNEKIDDLSNKLENANLEIANQTKELQSIRYENMKLNAQIDVLNKTVNTQNDELEHLRSINTE